MIFKFTRFLLTFLVVLLCVEAAIFCGLGYEGVLTTWQKILGGNGIAEAATFYPMPNNHVLFSILTCLTCLIKIVPVVQFRLVSIAATLATAYELRCCYTNRINGFC